MKSIITDEPGMPAMAKNKADVTDPYLQGRDSGCARTTSAGVGAGGLMQTAECRLDPNHETHVVDVLKD